MPKVSVIVPVYNVEKYLPKCLESLVNQTLEDIEIIVVNDSSPDNSQQIIDQFSELYPTKIKSFIKPNGGIADTRNFGLQQVTGEYFGFVDSDDYVELDMFELMYEKAKSTESQLVYCDFYWTYPTKLTESKERVYQDNKDLMIHMYATLWNKLYLTDWVKEIKLTFPKGLRYEDSSFLIQLAPHVEKMAHVDQALVYYVQREGSITHHHNHAVKDMIEVFNGLLVSFRQNQLYDTYQVELEYLFIKYFLGSSYLRACQIKDKSQRRETLEEGWNLLNNNFPSWKKNKYLKEKKDKKHLYFRLTNKVTYYALAQVFHYLKR
ncbi:MAG: glycosyltransferase family 2 protein [Turicibacter sp.]